MASKLDQAIAEIGIAYHRSGFDKTVLIAKAREVAAGVKPKELAKFPDKWYPPLGAKAAGAPDLADPWQTLWFEAMAEVLCQKKNEGLEGLFTYWERDDASHHFLILVRLLRLASEGIEKESILERVRARFETLHLAHTVPTIHEVVQWASFDPGLLPLLEPMESIVIPRSDGDTVGKYVRRSQGIYD